ncbi:hypothetical protein EYS14_02375 [Alteromonadaceae bacterium M269]|nr:hypothetical protein EYS14_02375 [Alteromonadaceae bacterium M269]
MKKDYLLATTVGFLCCATLSGCKSDLYIGPSMVCDTAGTLREGEAACAFVGIETREYFNLGTDIEFISGTEKHFCILNRTFNPTFDNGTIDCTVFSSDTEFVQSAFINERISDMESVANDQGVATCWLTEAGTTQCTGSLFDNEAFRFENVRAIASHEQEMCFQFTDRIDCYSDDDVSRTVDISVTGTLLSFDVSTTSACVVTLNTDNTTRLLCDNLTPPEIQQPVEVMVGDNFACALTLSNRADCFGDLPFEEDSFDEFLFEETLREYEIDNMDVSGSKICYVVRPLLSCIGEGTSNYPKIRIVVE